MSNRKSKRILIAIMVMVLSLGLITGCGSEEVSAVKGTLILKVNPEFEISYDQNGNVVSVMPMNEDAGKLMENVNAYTGQPTSKVIPQLVKLMDKNGYIEKDDKGAGRNINIEVKYGSELPDEKFLDTIVTNVKDVFKDKDVTGKVVISGESNYGYSSYEVSDYGKSDYKVNDSSNYDNNSNYSGNTNAGGSSSGTSANTNYSNYGDSSYDNNSNYSGNTNAGGSSSGTSANTNYSNYGNSSYDNNSNYSGNTNYSNYDNDSNSGYNNSSYDNDSNSGYDD